MQNRIWIEQRGETIAVRWSSDLTKRIQTCRNEDEARAFVAGFEEGLQEAKRILVDNQPRFNSAAVEVLT
jgi:transposase-like protein